MVGEGVAEFSAFFIGEVAEAAPFLAFFGGDAYVGYEGEGVAFFPA